MAFSYGSRSEPRATAVGFKGALCRPRILRTVLRARWSWRAIWRTETPSTRPRRSTSATFPDGSMSFIWTRPGARRGAPRERCVVEDHDHVAFVQIEAWAPRPPRRVVPTQDFAYSPARHVELAGDLAHRDALE